MKKFIMHWGVIMAGLFFSGLILAVEFQAYNDQPKVPVVCQFVKWDGVKDGKVKMKLKCGNKEYYSTSANLILWHINHPGQDISGMVNKDGEVWMKEKK